MTIFRDAIRSPITRHKYEKRLEQFLDFAGFLGELPEKVHAFTERAHNTSWATDTVMAYLRYHKARAEKGEISYSTLSNYSKSIKLLLDMNDIGLNWKKITRGIPKGRSYAQDRAPTIEEIRRLLEYPDRRIKPIVLTMASSGIRLGAWDYLKWGHIQSRLRGKETVAARVLVYAGTPEEYPTFISPEAYEELKEWIEFRQQQGEKITAESPVMRNLWDTAEPSGAIFRPKRLRSAGLKRLMERALWTQGLRQKLEPGRRRHEFQTDHGFRKFYKSNTERAMKSLHVEILMGHSVGLADNYYRAPEQELLESYLSALPFLTISETNELRRQDDQKMTERIVARDKKVLELERRGLELQGRLEKMEEQVQQIRTLVEKLSKH